VVNAFCVASILNKLLQILQESVVFWSDELLLH